MRVALHLSGLAARALLVALTLLVPVLVITVAAREVQEGADWIKIAPHRFFLAALLRALPLASIPAALLAAVWTKTSLDRRGEGQIFGLLGYSRWSVAVWASLPTLFLSLVMLQLVREAIPRAAMTLRGPVGLDVEEVSSWLVQRRERVGDGHLLIGAGGRDGTALIDLRLAQAEPMMVLRAQRAVLSAAEGESGKVQLGLSEGSLLLASMRELPLGEGSIQFERGEMRLDPVAATMDESRRFRRVAETKSGRLAKDAALLGRLVGAKRATAKLQYEQVHRPLLALLPFLLVFLLQLLWASSPYPALKGAKLWFTPALLIVAGALPLALARNAAFHDRYVLGLVYAAAAVLLPCLAVGIPLSRSRSLR